MIRYSGFTDEISNDLRVQVESAKKIGLSHISLRGVNGENISKFTLSRVIDEIVPVLNEFGIGVSSIGSPIGKVFIDDEDGFNEQLEILKELCKIANYLNTKYIRIFSFYIKEDLNYDDYEEVVLEKLSKFIEIAKHYGVCLIHENEKDIFGDNLKRCNVLAKNLYSDHFRLIFDFANFVQVNENTLDCYDILKPYIEYLHIKDACYTDSQNVLCGLGDGNISYIIKDLLKNRYDGFVTLEPHLVLFDSLQDLELKDASEIIKNNKEQNSFEAFNDQFQAVKKIIDGEI